MKHKTVIQLFLLLTVLMVGSKIYAQSVTMEYDKKSAEQIAKNTAMAAGAETLIKDTLKNIVGHNDSIAVMTSTITLLRNVYHNAYRNISGFKQESAVYKKIYNKVLTITPKIGVAITTITKNPHNAVASIPTIMRLKNRLISCCQMYSQIVANGHVDNPLKKDDRQSDGYNFLSFRDRYMMACQILSELNAIDWNLTMLTYNAAKDNLILNIIRYIDYDSYCTFYYGKLVSEDVLNKIDYWKKEIKDL